MLKPQNKILAGVVPYDECRAKTCDDGSPGTRVLDHCLYTGMVAEQLFTFIPELTKKLFPPFPGLLAAFHDIGKISPGFQGKYFLEILQKHSPAWAETFRNMGTNTAHADVGAAALRAYYKLSYTAPPVLAVAAHHGFKPQVINRLSDQENWQREREKLIQALEEKFKHVLTGEEISHGRADLLTGLICVADWIASDEIFFPPQDPPLPCQSLPTRVQDIVNQCGFRKVEFHQGLSFSDIFSFQPRNEQLKLIETISKPGVYILEATMGSGKTEAALYAAYRLMSTGINKGLYFALPTRLTSDRIHLRVEQFIRKILKDKQGVKLAHGQAWLKEFEYGSQGAKRVSTPVWFSPAKRGLLYPFSVGTIDQALLAVMNVKHSFVRLFGLAGKVVILDEVHSYDLYTGTILDELVEALKNLGCTVIILSATLTKARRQKLLRLDCDMDNAYPLITAMSTDDKTVLTTRPDCVQNGLTVSCQFLYGEPSQVVANALQHARNGENVVCIANTVKKAQLWYRSLLAEMNEKEQHDLKYGLLHSRFPLYRREAIEDEWMEMLGKSDHKRPSGSILIATQILEQSVDIDADYLISELAPMDMVLQRVGRLWRHQRDKRPCQKPVLTLVMENNPALCAALDEEAFKSCTGMGSWYVYAPYVLLRTWEILSRRRSLTLPNELRGLLESVYDENSVPKEPGLALDLYREMLEKQKKLRERAMSVGVSVTSLPTRSDDEQSAPTRYNSRPNVSLLIARELDLAAAQNNIAITLLNGEKVCVNKYKKNLSVTRKLYQNLVSIPIAKITANVKKDTELLRQHFFSSEMPFICILDDDGRSLKLHSSGQSLPYAFRNDFGIYDNEIQATSISADCCDSMPAEENFIFKKGEDW